MVILWTWENPFKRKSDNMGARPCDACGGKANYFGVYAMCFPCKDIAIEEFVSKNRDIKKILERITNEKMDR